MKFIKRLVIQYILTFTFGLILVIAPLINPYIFISSTFALMIFLFYTLMIINLGFTILYIIILFKYGNQEGICYDLSKFRILCHLCDYYPICKERKNN